MSQGFNELSQGLSIFAEQKIEPKVVAPSLDYTNLSKNLSVFESFNEEQSLFNTLLGRHHNKKSSAGGKMLFPLKLIRVWTVDALLIKKKTFQIWTTAVVFRKVNT